MSSPGPARCCSIPTEDKGRRVTLLPGCLQLSDVWVTTHQCVCSAALMLCRVRERISSRLRRPCRLSPPPLRRILHIPKRRASHANGTVEATGQAYGRSVPVVVEAVAGYPALTWTLWLSYPRKIQQTCESIILESLIITHGRSSTGQWRCIIGPAAHLATCHSLPVVLCHARIT